jgi:sigma-B regulation protein RsbU (phosphoserine phosphatase)
MVSRGGKIIRPQVEGVPVGLLDNQEYEETVFVTEPNDIILLYSDGIQDQTGTYEIEYGRNQLAVALAHYHQQSVRKIAEGIFTDLDRYMGHQAVFDDQTLIAIKVAES